MNDLHINADMVALSASDKATGRTDAASAKESIRVVNVRDIRVDWDRNPRKHSAYEGPALIALARNIYNYGLNDAPVLSERADKSLWLVKAHRRLKAILMIQTVGLPEGRSKRDEPAVAADPNFCKEIKCRVLKGMTIQDELDMLMDHVTVVGLDDQEKYLSARILTRAGFTHQFIADKIGVSRSNYSNGLARILAMPQCVEDAYLNDKEGAKRPTQEVLKSLYAAFQADQKRPGSRLKEAGPEFTAAWERFVSEGIPAKPKMIPREQLKTQATSLKDSDLLDVIQAIIDNQPNDLGNALTRLETRLNAANDNESTRVVSEGIETVL